MTLEYFKHVLTTSDIEKGETVKVLDDIRCILINRDLYEPYNEIGDRYIEVRETYIVILKNNEIIGGILKMENDLFIYIFEEYQGKGICSKVMSNNFIQELWPDIESMSCDRPSQYFRIKHLSEISGLPIRNIYSPTFVDFIDEACYKKLELSDFNSVSEFASQDTDIYADLQKAFHIYGISPSYIYFPNENQTGVYLLSISHNTFYKDDMTNALSIADIKSSKEDFDFNRSISIDTAEYFHNLSNNSDSYHCMILTIGIYKYGKFEYERRIDVSTGEKVFDFVRRVKSFLSGGYLD